MKDINASNTKMWDLLKSNLTNDEALKMESDISILRLMVATWLKDNEYAKDYSYTHMYRLLGLDVTKSVNWTPELIQDLRALLGPHGRAYYQVLKVRNKKDEEMA